VFLSESTEENSQQKLPAETSLSLVWVMTVTRQDGGSPKKACSILVMYEAGV